MADRKGKRERGLYGLKAISKYLGGKSGRTIRKLIKEEGLPAKKLGGEWFCDESWIDAWLMRGH